MGVADVAVTTLETDRAVGMTGDTMTKNRAIETVIVIEDRDVVAGEAEGVDPRTARRRPKDRMTVGGEGINTKWPTK